MKVTSKNQPDVIEIHRGETLTVSSTYEMIKQRYSLPAFRSVKLIVYDNFFLVEAIDASGKSKRQAFSDTWDFDVR